MYIIFKKVQTYLPLLVDERDSVVPFNEENYFSHYRAMGDAATLKDSFEIKVL